MGRGDHHAGKSPPKGDAGGVSAVFGWNPIGDCGCDVPFDVARSQEKRRFEIGYARAGGDFDELI